MISAVFFILAGAYFLTGCSPVVANQPIDKNNVANNERVDSGSSVSTPKSQNADIERLARLWQQRSQGNSSGDYPLGPGDLLEIYVPGMEELKQTAVRVSGEGTIALPYVGVVNVTGMTEKMLKEEIRSRLLKDFMHDPQVTVFAKEARSRQVAVIGAVQKPGLYNLASASDTILGMISHAGGMRSDAAERILFIPAEPAEPEKAKEIIAALPAALVSRDPTPLILKDVEPIVIHLNSVIRGGSQSYLAMPARPGDVIMVPGGGEVLIQGWVARPGAYKISPGLTILGAVAAAGGPSFPADPGAVEIIRTNNQGQKISLPADLGSIKRGEQPDITLQEGDVIDVASSGPKLVAYNFYRFFTSIMSIGASIPIPIK